MELKEFVKNVIVDLDKAVTEANIETTRKVTFRGVKEKRTSLEFDVAVTVETKGESKGGATIKVWGIAEAGVGVTSESKNSTVSRVSFSIDISEKTKTEEEEESIDTSNQFSSTLHTGM